MLPLAFAFAMGSDADPYESFGAVDAAAERPEAQVDTQPERPNFILVNAPGVLVGRLGFDFGSMIVPHVAATGSVHVHVTYPPRTLTHESLFGAGGELGVRLYGSARRPAGPFLGGYLIGGRYYAESSGDFASASSWRSTVGGAADVGWSWVAKSGFVFAMGGGVEYRIVKTERPGMSIDVAELFASAGFGPRGLVQFGMAF